MDRKANPLAPRRLAVAAVLFLVLTATSVLAIGLVDDETPFGPLPESFGVAAPRIGDRGNYTYSQIGSDGAVLGEELPFLEFEQLESVEELDASGQPVRVNRLQQREAHYQWTQDDLVWRLDVPLAWASRSTDGRVEFLDGDALSELFGSLQNDSVDVAGIPVVYTTASTEGNLFLRVYVTDDDRAAMAADSELLHEDLVHFCGARNALQGERRDLAEPFPLMGCYFSDWGADPTRRILTEVEGDLRERLELFLEPTDQYRALGTQQAGDDSLVVFGRVDDSGEQTPTRVNVWMDADVPYPLQLAIRPAGSELTHVLRLVAFERGTEALASEPPTSTVAAPPLVFGGANPWGPDDSGTAVRIKPSDAWAAAQDDATVAAYLQANPDAYLYELHGEQSIDFLTGEETYVWAFGVGDGKSGLQFEVTATIRPLVPVPPALGLPFESPKGDPTFEVSAESDEDAPTMDPELYPTTMPTAASLVARGNAFSPPPPDLPEALWNMYVDCVSYREEDGPRDGDCLEWGASHGVGIAWQTFDIDATSDVGRPTMSAAIAEGALSFDEEGSADFLYAVQARSTSTYGATPTSRTAAGSGEPFEAPAAATGLWNLPSAKQAAGATFIGLLVSALYLAWPTVKGFGLALYARVTGNELLENPTRQRLLAAIEANPGIHAKELARVADLGWGTVQHHMAKLTDAGIVIGRRNGGFLCYFVRSGTDRRLLDAAGAVKSDGSRRLLAAIARQPGRPVMQLAHELAIRESTAHYHLKRLEQAGLVASVKEGASRRVTATTLGEDVLRRFGSGAGNVPATAAA